MCAYVGNQGVSPTENFKFPVTMRATPTITVNRQSSDSYNLSGLNQRNQTVDSFNMYMSASSTNSMVAVGHNAKPMNLVMEAEL